MEMIFLNIIYSLILSLLLTLVLKNINIIELELHELLFIFIIGFFSYFAAAFFNNALGIPMIFVLGSIYLYLKSKKIFKSLISIFISLLILILCDAISGSIIIFILKYKYSDLNKNNLPSWSLYIFMFILSYILSKIVGYISTKLLSKNSNVKGTSSLSTIIIINMFTAIFILYVNEMLNRLLEPSLSRTYTATSTVLYCIYFASNFILMFIYAKDLKTHLNYESRKNEFLQLKEYTEVIEQTLNDLRCFKHDYANILSSIGGYIDNNDMVGLKDFYSNNLNNSSKAIFNKNSNITNLKYLKIPSLKGLLSSKVLKANALNIETTVGLVEDINDIPMDIIDLTRIIGILFDNAIEAASSCDNPKIDFGIIKKNDNIVIFISNACSPDTPPIHQIYKKGFSTKGENRGLGLYTLKSIIDKNYKNVTINTSNENHIFKQILCISPKISNIKEYQKAI